MIVMTSGLVSRSPPVAARPVVTSTTVCVMDPSPTYDVPGRAPRFGRSPNAANSPLLQSATPGPVAGGPNLEGPDLSIQPGPVEQGQTMFGAGGRSYAVLS